MRHLIACTGSLLSLLLFSASALAQSLVDKDVTYGLTLHGRVMESSSAITSGETHDKLQAIFANLKQTPAVQQGPPLPYSLTYLNRPDANAFSGAGGRLYLTEGLARITNGDSSMLAFSLGHEMAHSMGHHYFKRYLREVAHQVVLQTYRRRMAYGDKRRVARCWYISPPIKSPKARSSAMTKTTLIALAS